MNPATTITNTFFKIVFNKAIITVASFVCLFAFSNGAFAATNTYLSNGTFTVPVGVNQLTVSMSGAGGGGGALSNSGAGADGGLSSVGTLLTAFGGHGGRNGSADVGAGAGGLAGGLGGSNGSNGTVLGYGGDGGNGLFGTSGQGNTNMFYNASNGIGYGAGGGGGFDGGGAGAGGAFSSTTISVIPGQIIPITVGVAGSGSTGNGVMAAGGNGAPGFVQITYTLDTTAPVIILTGSTVAIVSAGTTYADAGATAFDNIDGNISANIITANPVNTNIPGVYTITYNVSDTSGNVAVQVTRTVNVVDTTVPVITLIGTASVNISAGMAYVDAGATAFDNIDGNITANIIVTGSVNTATPGTYTMSYSVSDSAGNTATTITRTINVVDADVPVITILGNNPETVTQGTIYVDAGATALDNIDGDITANIVATSTVDTTIIGTYTVSYTVSDVAGNTASGARTVDVIAVVPLSQVTITNSTIGGIFYASYTPTVASSTALGITGTSTIINSTINAPWNLTDVNFDGVTLTNATLAQSTVASSTIINALLTSCTISNSFVKNYFAIGCTITDSLVDPVGGLNDLTGSTVSGGSSIYYSDVTYSTVISSYIATSTITASTLTNATSTNSMMATSTVANSTIDLATTTSATINGSTVTSVTVDASDIATSTISGGSITASSSITNSTFTNATVSSSTISNTIISGTNSTITNSTLTGLSVTDATIVNNVMSSGTIVLPDSTIYTVLAPTTLSSLVNYAPVASFVTSTSSLDVTITDTSSDLTDTLLVTDSWTYDWSFGDGATSTFATTTIGGNDQSHTYSASGSYTVLLTVTDQYGLSSATSTLVTVTAPTIPDTTAPVITILGNNPESVVQGTTYTDTDATALDNIDGDITANIVATSTVDTTTAGAYTVIYTVSDLAGNTASSTRVVNVTVAPDTTAPVIAIIGADPVSVVIGSTYTDLGATALDNFDGDISANIIATSTVDTATTGTYTVIYAVSDLAGNTASSTRTVNVLAAPDTTVPVITIVGSNPASVTVGNTYTDLGATALDDIDGDITANIVVTSTVDTLTVGSYAVSYSVTDSSGNTATSSRAVDVIAAPVADTTAPTTPIVASVNTVATSTLGATLTALWSDATDNSGLLAGYSFVWDVSASTDPDTIVEGQATTTTATLPNGTWYFHVIAVDPSLNVSVPTATFGPIVINNAPAGDTTAPTGPTAVNSSTHTVGVSSATTTIALDWDTATDDTLLAGYSYVWDANISTTPDNVADTSATSLATNLPNGTWYFHIISVDASSNASSPVVDFGPIIIATSTTDFIPPVGPTTVTSSSHTVSLTSINQNVNVSWDTATDESALAGYSYIWDTATSTTPDAIPEIVATSVATILPNGTWYFHVLSVDTAGNISSPVVDFGPIVINTLASSDTTAPSAPVATVITSTVTTLNASWTDATDDSGLLAGYSFVWGTNPATTPDAITETQGTSTSATLTDGLWYFHIVAVDSSLNISTPTTTFGPIKIDTTAPTLTLVGVGTVPVVVGNTYVDAGTTALDAIDGDITSSIIVSNPVDTNVIGTYTITYNVSDTSGNSAAALTRTVHVIAVPDTTAPVITIVGVNPVTIVQNNTYTDLGATATDNVDSNITANIMTMNLVNTAVVGTYAVNYSVTDSSMNTGTSTRTVNVITPVYFNLGADVVGNGTINPNATTTILQGSNQSYTITPNFGHEVSSLFIDGISVATSTLYTFTNVQADHTISAVFAQISGAPSFTLFASTGTNGSITPVGTTTVLQGNEQVYTITPDAGYSINTLTVDGIATSTSSTFTFANINADHTIDVTFIDPIAPVGPTSVTSSSHVTSVISTNFSVDTAWDTATDNVALAGYSYVWDNNSLTTPDAIFDTVSTSATTVLTNGTWYFHVVGVDTAGNISAPVVHFGPVVISDSQVLITNSTINGVSYPAYSPTVASSTTFGVTGSSTLTNTTLVSPFTLTDVTIATSTLTQTSATGSMITNSTLINATTTSSTISGSTITSGDITNSTLTNVQVVGASSTITNSTLQNTTVTDAVIVNDVMTSGTIVLPNGTPFVVTTPTPLTTLVNYAPVASFNTSTTDLVVTITDTTTDSNNVSTTDSWTYNWNFGDSSSVSYGPSFTIGNNQTHTYSAPGTYVVTLTVTDLAGFGLSSSATSSVAVATVTVPPVTTTVVGYLVGTVPAFGGGGWVNTMTPGVPVATAPQVVTTSGQPAVTQTTSTVTPPETPVVAESSPTQEPIATQHVALEVTQPVQDALAQPEDNTSLDATTLIVADQPTYLANQLAAAAGAPLAKGLAVVVLGAFASLLMYRYVATRALATVAQGAIPADVAPVADTAEIVDLSEIPEESKTTAKSKKK